MLEFIKSRYSHNICVWCPFMITIWTCIYDFGQYILTLFVNCMNIVTCNYGARGVQLWIINHPTLGTLLQNTSAFQLHSIKHMQKQKQMTHGSKLINLPFALVTFMCLCLFSRISKWSRLEVSFLNILCISFSFGDVIIICGTELRLFLPF